MAAFTLVQARAKLELWMAADEAVATGQEYEIDVSGTKRKLTRADAGMIQKRIQFWSHVINQKQHGRVRYAVPE